MLLLVSWIKKNESSKDNDPLVYVSAAYCPVTEWLPNVTNRYTDGHQAPPLQKNILEIQFFTKESYFLFLKKQKLKAITIKTVSLGSNEMHHLFP